MKPRRHNGVWSGRPGSSYHTCGQKSFWSDLVLVKHQLPLVCWVTFDLRIVLRVMPTGSTCCHHIEDRGSGLNGRSMFLRNNDKNLRDSVMTTVWYLITRTSYGSSVRAGRSGVWIPAKKMGLSFLQNAQTGSGAFPASCSLGAGVLSRD